MGKEEEMKNEENGHSIILIRLNEVRKITGLSRATIYAWIKEGISPARSRLGNGQSPGSWARWKSG